MLKRKYLMSFAFIIIVLIGSAGVINANFKTADNFEKIVIFMAAGEYNTSVPPVEGDLAMWYHRQIMGRSDAEIAAEKAMAWDYFNATFGPVPEPVAFGLDPRNEYRAYYMSDENIPPEGWVVRDGGFLVSFAVPTTLHGTWGGTSGKTVPAGSMIVFGNYNIDTTRPKMEEKKGKGKEPIIIHYQSAEPIVPDTVNNGIAFRCELIAPWGGGVAQGLSYVQDLGNGRVQANIRNVQTYPPYGPSVVHDIP